MIRTSVQQPAPPVNNANYSQVFAIKIPRWCRESHTEEHTEPVTNMTSLLDETYWVRQIQWLRDLEPGGSLNRPHFLLARAPHFQSQEMLRHQSRFAGPTNPPHDFPLIQASGYTILVTNMLTGIYIWLTRDLNPVPTPRMIGFNYQRADQPTIGGY